ncbi:MAG: single-stranded-DNA-specific exonuclease RecJ, partial [Alphaproteobacteria bacterium]|nr:single-stranded-DNA-specific exonuclease RecJ [Alphaproteobacteria bacterium]
VLPEKVEALREFLINHIQRQMENASANVETVIDGVLTTGGVTVNLIKTLQDSIGPFGQENPEPLFLLQNVRIRKSDILGGSHIRVMLSDWEGGGTIKAMAFRSVGTPLGEALLNDNRRMFHIAGTLKINEWQGKVTPEMHIQDAALSNQSKEDLDMFDEASA